MTRRLHLPTQWGICPRCGMPEPDLFVQPCLSDAEMIERAEKQVEATMAAEAFNRINRNGRPD